MDEPQHDEGEPQMKFLRPAEGGRYIRNADGSLTRVQGAAPAHNDSPKAKE